jgi:3-isopropylmalate/(R)-2-methylmalate dehydratase large subunit
MTTAPKTLFEKVWQQHVVVDPQGEPTVLYIDLQLLHEVTSPQAFEGLRIAGRKVRRPDRCIATVDHNVPTTIEGRLHILDQIAATQIDALRKTAPTSASSYTTSTHAIKASSTSSAPSSASPSPA